MIVLIDATSDSLTVSWTAVTDAANYTLQYRRGGTDDEYKTLSDKLTTTQARKKNLSDENRNGFSFRVKPVGTESWQTHPEDSFRLLTTSEERGRMDPPTVEGFGNRTVLARWTARDDADGYELQMRENAGGVPWETIAPSLKGTEVKKKNLTSINGYQFRVRPAGGECDAPFSTPSGIVVAPTLSPGLKTIFRNLEKQSLLQNPDAKPVALDDALAGQEFVLLYASAHWCGPCRQFTPKLASWYQTLQSSGGKKTAEIVFLSADHDERGFREYYRSMPWLAVDYEDDVREELMGKIGVRGIPHLTVLDGRTGRVLEANAVSGGGLDVGRWRKLAASGGK